MPLQPQQTNESCVGVKFTSNQFAAANNIPERSSRQRLRALLLQGIIHRLGEGVLVHYVCPAENLTPQFALMFGSDGDGLAEYTTPTEYFLWAPVGLPLWAKKVIRDAAEARKNS